LDDLIATLMDLERRLAGFDSEERTEASPAELRAAGKELVIAGEALIALADAENRQDRIEWDRSELTSRWGGLRNDL